MLDSIYHNDTFVTLKSREKVKILLLCTQRFYGRHSVTLAKYLTTSGLSMVTPRSTVGQS